MAPGLSSITAFSESGYKFVHGNFQVTSVLAKDGPRYEKVARFAKNHTHEDCKLTHVTAMIARKDVKPSGRK